MTWTMADVNTSATGGFWGNSGSGSTSGSSGGLLGGATTSGARSGTSTGTSTGTRDIQAAWTGGDPNRVYELAKQQGLSAQSLAGLVGTDVGNINSWLTANNKALTGTNTATRVDSRAPTVASVLGGGPTQYTNLDANYNRSITGSYNNGGYTDYWSNQPLINLSNYTPGSADYANARQHNVNVQNAIAGTANATGANADRAKLNNYITALGVPPNKVGQVKITDELLTAAGLGTGAGVQTGTPNYNYQLPGLLGGGGTGTTGGTPAPNANGGSTGTTGGTTPRPPGGMNVNANGGLSSTGGSTSFNEQTGTYTGTGTITGGSAQVGPAIQAAWTAGSPMEVYKLATKNGWTVEQVANLVGTDPNNIYGWLTAQGLQWGPMSSQMFTQSFNTQTPGAAPNLSYDAYTTDPKALSYSATTVDPMALRYSATTVDPKALTYDPVTGQVSYATDTVEGRLAGLLSANNPLMSLANQKALEGFASRGMLNSGDAQQAAMLAMLQAGTQIAQPDAAAYRQQALQNQADKNQALQNIYNYQSQQTFNNQNAQNDAAKNVYAYQTQQTLANQSAQNEAAKNVYAYQTQQTLQNQQDINTARRDVYGYQTDMAKLDRTEQWKQSSMQLEGQIKQQLAMSDASLNAYLEGIKSQYAIDLQNVEQSGEFAGQAATLYDSAMRSLSNIGAQDLTTEQYNAAVTQVLAALDSALAFNSALYGLNYSNIYGNNLTTNPGAVGGPPPSGGTPPGAGANGAGDSAYQAYLAAARLNGTEPMSYAEWLVNR